MASIGTDLTAGPVCWLLSTRRPEPENRDLIDEIIEKDQGFLNRLGDS